MLFNSLEFLVFFPVVTFMNFATPARFRWVLLLLASCFFYAFFIPKYLLILFALILLDYLAGIVIEKAKGHKRKTFLIFSLLANIGALAVFKYFNFLNTNLSALFQSLHLPYAVRNLDFILPIGLSFHTFQSMAYTIEVYKGTQKAERHLGYYALYVMFYPQLVAGPIERPGHLLPQFHKTHDFNAARAYSGLRLMLWGFFKKVVVADNAAVLVNVVFNDPHKYSGIPLILATYFFTFQIYCDFSGYSDIAIGAARVLGIDLSPNFDRPYASRSVSEFWRRWHISLSSWFRDYLYILGLGGNQVSRFRYYANLMIVFLVSGFWHGANWTFVAWGALHGSYLVVGIWTKELRTNIARWIGINRAPRLLACWQIFVTFNLVSLAWVLFRANTISDAWHVYAHLFTGVRPFHLLANLGQIGTGAGILGQSIAINRGDFMVVLFAVLVMELVQRFKAYFYSAPVAMRWGVYYALIFSILLFGNFESREFIYFQF